MLNIGIINECSDNEKRVALVPGDITGLKKKGLTVIIESGSGIGSLISDDEFVQSGAYVVASSEEVLKTTDIVLMLQRPDEASLQHLKDGQIIVGSIYPLRFAELVKKLASAKTTTFSLELIPRITRAQSMDVLSSQSSVAGYRAAISGAYWCKRFMPMLTTAAGTVRPASVLVIGAGVAGLMAIATSRRLGASVTAYDVRKAAGDDVRSLGAKFLEFGVDAVGEGGYARELTDEEKKKESDILENAIINSDLIITTAGVPGKIAPVIIRKETLQKMKRGTVIVDVVAESGGNCELTRAGEIVDTGNVMIIGPLNPPAEVPVNASQMYSRNLVSFLSVLIDSSGNTVDPAQDDILRQCMLCTDGKITFEPLSGGEK